MRTLNVVDIGGYTVDVLKMTDFRPDMSVCTSLYYGTNTLVRDANERMRATGTRERPRRCHQGRSV